MSAPPITFDRSHLPQAAYNPSYARPVRQLLSTPLDTASRRRLLNLIAIAAANRAVPPSSGSAAYRAALAFNLTMVGTRRAPSECNILDTPHAKSHRAQFAALLKAFK